MNRTAKTVNTVSGYCLSIFANKCCMHYTAAFHELQSVTVQCTLHSLQGDGVPPTEAREFCEWLFAGKCGKLPNLHYSVCALGDK